MAITLTENAAKQILRQLAKRGSGIALRIGLKTVGCNGLAHANQYLRSMVYALCATVNGIEIPKDQNFTVRSGEVQAIKTP